MPSNDTQNIYSTQYGGGGEPIPATKIGYDNTTSGLTADDVQEAIDEVAGKVDNLTAADVTYDNTTSGLTADDVQEAIDEVFDKCSNEYISGIVSPNLYDHAFTSRDSYTILEDGWYNCLVQNDAVSTGVNLIVGIDTDKILNVIKTTGVAYSFCYITLPLKAGTEVFFKCGDADLNCHCRVTKMS